MILLLAMLLAHPRSLAEVPPFPSTLSQAGLFESLQPLTPGPALVPYEINQSFWSDGASKQRWMRLPPGEHIKYSPDGEWTFPPGTLFVKHFQAPSGRALETRLLYVGVTNVQGGSYRWRSDGADAELLETNLLVNLPGTNGVSTWYYPSREDCRTCHNLNAGLVLGVNARQLNRTQSSGHNQLKDWSEFGLFDRALPDDEIAAAEKLASGSTQDQVRTYLDVNCAFCHRPGGSPSYFDARWSGDIRKLIDAPVLFNQGVDAARVIAPHDPWRSILLLRLESLDGLKMPPIAHQRVDTNAVALVRQWVQSLPGPDVVPPPQLTPPGGEYRQPIQVVLLSPAPDSVIRFTTNGAAPGKNSPIYSAPILLRESATVRARAYKENLVRSVPVQETYLIAP